jgi:hypothetical protein
MALAAVRKPDRHAALVFLNQALPSLETPAPGLRNEGLFALHELTNDAPRRPEWKEHQARARTAIGAEGHELLHKLGFTIDKLDNLTLLLKGADRRLALAVVPSFGLGISPPGVLSITSRGFPCSAAFRFTRALCSIVMSTLDAATPRMRSRAARWASSGHRTATRSPS